MSVIDSLKQVLDETPGVRLAVLFGSAAKGTARRHSDLDVGVWLDTDGANCQPLSTLAVALERAATQPVDLVPLDTAPPRSFASRSRAAVSSSQTATAGNGRTSARTP